MTTYRLLSREEARERFERLKKALGVTAQAVRPEKESAPKMEQAELWTKEATKSYPSPS